MLLDGPGLASDIPMAHQLVDRGLCREIDLGHVIDVSVTPLGHLALKQADEITDRSSSRGRQGEEMTPLETMQQEVSDVLRKFVESNAKSADPNVTLGNIIGYLIGISAGTAQSAVPLMGEEEFVNLCRKIYVESNRYCAQEEKKQ